MKHNILVKNKETLKSCLDTKHLMDSLGTYTDLVPKACHNGACGLCKIKIHKGEFRINKMNRKHISLKDEWDYIFLACRVFPLSDMEIEFLPKVIKKDNNKEIYILGK